MKRGKERKESEEGGRQREKREEGTEREKRGRACEGKRGKRQIYLIVNKGIHISILIQVLFTI